MCAQTIGYDQSKKIDPKDGKNATNKITRQINFATKENVECPFDIVDCNYVPLAGTNVGFDEKYEQERKPSHQARVENSIPRCTRFRVSQVRV